MTKTLPALLACACAALLTARAHAAPTEWWVLAAQLDSGDRVIVELTLTDLGPGSRNAAAIGNWVAPDGTLTPFSRAKLGGDWTPSPDGRRIDLQKFVFDCSTERAAVQVEKRSLRIVLEFPLGAAPVATRPLAGGKWVQELWAGGAPVTATLWRRGMTEAVRTTGRVALSHRSVDGPEAKLARRRTELFALGAAPTYVVEIARAEGAERWAVALDEQGRRIVEDAAAAAVGERLDAPSARLALSGPSVLGSLGAGARLAAYDPLGDLPAPIRFLLGLRLRSLWMASPYALRVREGAQETRREGTAIASYTFYQ